MSYRDSRMIELLIARRTSIAACTGQRKMQIVSARNARRAREKRPNAARSVANARRAYRFLVYIDISTACFRKSARGRRPLSSRRSAGCIVRGATRRESLGERKRSSLSVRESHRCLRRPCRRVRARAITQFDRRTATEREKKRKREREGQVARRKSAPSKTYPASTKASQRDAYTATRLDSVLARPPVGQDGCLVSRRDPSCVFVVYRVERDGDDSCFARAQLILVSFIESDGNAARQRTTVRD